jgi:hypothetical protein
MLASNSGRHRFRLETAIRTKLPLLQLDIRGVACLPTNSAPLGRHQSVGHTANSSQAHSRNPSQQTLAIQASHVPAFNHTLVQQNRSRQFRNGNPCECRGSQIPTVTCSTVVAGQLAGFIERLFSATIRAGELGVDSTQSGLQAKGNAPRQREHIIT